MCLFTCLNWLKTWTPKLALALFIERRGQPQSIISDNGTNFVGAATEFKEAFQELSKGKIASRQADEGIKWIFNTSAAPHFEGVGEPLVKSCKKALCNVLRKQSLIEDIFSRALFVVKQLMNNRPITNFSGYVSNFQPLTPNHSQIGQISTNWPNALFSETTASYRKLIRDQHSVLIFVLIFKLSVYHACSRRRGRIAEIVRSALLGTAMGSYKTPLVKLIAVNSDRKWC